jgi:aminodeoxyfutalosine deaminase
MDQCIENFVRKMPKAELHVHLEGSISPETLFTLAEKNDIKLLVSSQEEIMKHYRYRNFDDFKNILLSCIRVLRKPDDFYTLTHIIGKQFHEQNIRYSEIFWTPQFYRNLGFSYDELFEALSSASKEIHQRLNIQINWIPDLVRSRPDPAREVMLWAAKESSRLNGVVALGLAGPENGFPLKPFVEIFNEARKLGLPANPHSGEGTSSNLVDETIQLLHPIRIGHGVSCHTDKKLVRKIVNKQIALEICLSSNIQLGLYPDYKSHPLSNLMKAGCMITLNSDDPALFSTNLSHEYMIAIQYCGITISQIESIALNALRSSYLDDVSKQKLIKEFRASYSQLRQSYGIQN